MKTAKRKWLSILLVAVLALSALAGCGGGSAGGGDNGETATPPADSEISEPETTPGETPDAPAPTAGGLPENISDLAIILEGDAITLPVTVEDFLTLGWGVRYEDILKITLESKQYTSFGVEKDGHAISVYVANFLDDQSSTIQQSTVIGFVGELKWDTVFELPHGIKLGVSTIDDVIAAFGEPSKFVESGEADYFMDGYNIYIFWDADSGITDRFNIQKDLSGFEGVVI